MKHKVIAIVGPTASGKTKMAIDLAKQIDGEVISADSRYVYKGFDIAITLCFILTFYLKVENYVIIPVFLIEGLKNV